MQITWLGHASFRIEISGKTLLIDPWLSGNPMLTEAQHGPATEGATHILLTHGHFDHVIDTLPLAKRLGIPVVGQYDLMGHWAGRPPARRLIVQGSGTSGSGRG